MNVPDPLSQLMSKENILKYPRIIFVLLILGYCSTVSALRIDQGEGNPGGDPGEGPADEPVSHESAPSAVPPPLGPVATVQQANTPEVGTGQLRDLVENRAGRIVDATNVDLAAQGKPYRASVAGVTAWSPYLAWTQYVDRPNQYFVRQPFLIKIDVDIPWASNRSVYLPLDIEVFCDGWHRSDGLVRFFSAPAPASIEGGNILEEIIRVRDIIDAKVLAGFPGLAHAEEPQLNALADLKGRACATIGATDGPDSNFDAIIWGHPLRLPDTRVRQQIEVTPLTLRRLLATRIDTGAPIGNPIEQVSLVTYANFHAVESPQLAMHVNNEIALNLPTMVLYGEPTKTLVVIGDVRNELLATAATAFSATTQSIDYSPGTHTLQLQTEYWMPAKPPAHKPSKMTATTYELTYQVKYVPPLAGNSPQ
jgi:hypothetical protein